MHLQILLENVHPKRNNRNRSTKRLTRANTIKIVFETKKNYGDTKKIKSIGSSQIQKS